MDDLGLSVFLVGNFLLSLHGFKHSFDTVFRYVLGHK